MKVKSRLINDSNSMSRYQTALHRAVLCDNEEILRLLLSRGAEPNIGDKEGLTPLALAKRYPF